MADIKICPVCSQPYEVHSHTVADQTKCPECVAELKRRMEKPIQSERERYEDKRRKYFEAT